MAHFARVEDGIVKEVIVINNVNAPDPATDTSEVLGQTFIRDVLKLDGEWIQTSRNNNFRGNFAGPGMIWDSVNDVFYKQQPFDSWSLNTTTWKWDPPYPYPNDLEPTYWDEWSGNWVVYPMPIEVWNRIAQLQFTSIMEAGCLIGSVTNKLAETYPTATVKGIDIVERGIELAKEYYDETLFEVQDVYQANLNSYDVVIWDSPIPTEEVPTPAADLIAYAESINFSGILLLGLYDQDTIANGTHIVDHWYQFDFTGAP